MSDEKALRKQISWLDNRLDWVFSLHETAIAELRKDLDTASDRIQTLENQVASLLERSPPKPPGRLS